MQRYLSLYLRQKSTFSLCNITHLRLIRYHAYTAAAISRKRNVAPAKVVDPKPITSNSSLQNPPIPLDSVEKLLNGSWWPRVKPAKNYGRWSLKLQVRKVRGLVSGLTPEHAVAAVEYAVSAPHLPEQLRPRLLAKASHIFLRSGNFRGALRMYRVMVSEGYSPPLSLITALYRASKTDIARKATNTRIRSPVIGPEAELLSPADDHQLALLLSTLEPLQQPELMEDILRKYTNQTSHSCFENPSVVASMIRGYHAAGQLDGCYAWFQRYRRIWARNDGPTPAAPYVCLMVASRKLMPKNTAALYGIMKTMREDRAALTTPIYNEVLASELRNRRFERIFSLFIALQHEPSSLQPDAYTFSLVFDALWKNETGPRHEVNLNPQDILHQMLHLFPPVFTVRSSNTVLRYFAHIGDFQSAIKIVKAMMTRCISPNALTIRWVLEEILKRCQVAFTPAASLDLERWTKNLLGGLTRDHLAHVSHFLDIVWSTRDDTKCHTVTQSTKDALLLMDKAFVSRRSSPAFSTDQQRKDFPVLSMIHDILQVCSNAVCVVQDFP
ncbi:Type I inositol-1,4,5-trisphosphate 5-phosphatase [Ceratobasidium theobromae]|uniref:Type I inositol-1,4,5-trisphosphate 5-phosphatase n=1 Tax=Ceratobasidium theobromae TaxID=1582974 RepID=A0A5N5QUR3_9AGAM|nr:Type I inositol-1,4,5-trisphosphate 5-phosphatase [Ceratobasidium theobromae]